MIIIPGELIDMQKRIFPEIERMTSLKDVRAALRMGYNTFDNVKDEFKPELTERLEALEARRKYLGDVTIPSRKGVR